MRQNWQNQENRKRIKFAKREALLAKSLIPLIEQTLRESPTLERFFVSRIALSKEGGCVSVFVSRLDDQPVNAAELTALKSYKVPVRNVIAGILCSKWTPEVSIRFDQKFAKVRHTEALMQSVFERENCAETTTVDALIKELAKQ